MRDFELRDEAPERLGISHYDVLDNPDLWSKYDYERRVVIRTGEPTWAMRWSDRLENPEADDQDLVFDYYIGSEPRGMVEGNETDGFFALGPPLKEQMGALRLNHEPLASLHQAQSLVEKYFKVKPIAM